MVTNITNFQQHPQNDMPTARDINTVGQRKARMPTTTFDEVRRFLVANWRAKESQIAPSTRLLHDLGIDADDAAAILTAFSEKFSVDLSSFPFSMHFGSEADAGFRWIVRRIRGRDAIRLRPVTVQDLVDSANLGRWWRANERTPNQTSEVNGRAGK
jgi:acyl carrier protein